MSDGTVTIRPRARDFIIKRPRLTKLLDEAGARILLLLAPAGYGKTTLAREWTAEKEKVSWYAGGTAMADVAALAVGLAETLAGMGAPARDDLPERVRILAARGHDPRGLAKAVAAGAPGSEWLVVIDDYHYAAESAESEMFIEQLVELTDFRLLLTSRERPAWLAARKVVYGEAAVLEMEALAFTDDEARAVLGDSESGGREQIVSEARGWPAVIGLAAIRTRGNNLRAGLGPSDLYDFFADELFRGASVPLRDGMFLLALGGDTSFDVARELLGANYAEFIAEAGDRGLLTSSVERVVNVHPLLRSYFLARLAGLAPDEIRSLLMRVLSCLAARRRWDACLLALEKFPQPDLVLSTLNLGFLELLDSGRVATVSRWLEIAKECELSDALLLLAEAEVALRQRDDRRAQTLGERAADLLEGDLAARAHLVAARAAHMRDDSAAVLRNCQRACGVGADLRVRIEALWIEFSNARERSTADASEVLRRLEDFNHTSPSHALHLLTAKGMLLFDESDVRGATQQFELAAALLTEVRDPFARTGLFNFLAHLYLLLGRYEDSLAVTARQIEEGRESNLEFVLDHALLKRAGALIGTRQFGTAQRVIDELHRRSDAASSHVLDNTSLQTVKLRIGLGDLERAAILLEREPADSGRHAFRGELLAYRSLVSAALGDINKATSNLAEGGDCFRFAEAAAMRDLAEAVIDLQGGGDLGRQASVLDRLIALGQLDAIVTACRAYPRLASIPAEAHAGNQVRKALAEIFASSRDNDIAKTAGLRVARELSRKGILSPRERDVYELLIQGRGNREIAKALFISQSTTKVHVRHIFEKLGVHSRAEAARMAVLDETN